MPLGSVQPTSMTGSCPTVATCTPYTVSCPGLPDAKFVVGISPSTVTPKAVLMLFSGGSSGGWWSDASGDIAALLPPVRAMGYTVLQVRWASGIYAVGGSTEDFGPAKLMCRAATAQRFIHDYYYQPLDINPVGVGVCGFCVSGNSGGANLIGYGLTHYGLAPIIDVAIPSGGPPWSTIAKSCMLTPGEEKYWFKTDDRQGVDDRYGFSATTTGPCMTHNPAWVSRWNADALATGGNNYYYPTTRVFLLEGATDKLFSAVSLDFYARMQSAGSPYVSWEATPSAGHTYLASVTGRAVWLQRLQQSIPS